MAKPQQDSPTSGSSTRTPPTFTGKSGEAAPSLPILTDAENKPLHRVVVWLTDSAILVGDPKRNGKKRSALCFGPGEPCGDWTMEQHPMGILVYDPLHSTTYFIPYSKCYIEIKDL